MLFIAFLVLLQSQSAVGELAGLVRNETGQPVPGTEVVLRTADMVQRTAADERGRFRFESLTPGNYVLDFSKAGFFRLADQPVVVQAGVNEITVTLNQEHEVHSELDVLSVPQEIVPRQTQHEDVIAAYEIRENPAPSSHSLQNALPAVPSIVQDSNGSLHVAGGRSTDSLYLLDGFEISNPANGAFDARLNVDAVREADVTTGRYDAAFASAGSGVVDLETDSGDDRWRFGVTNFLPSFDTQRGVHLGNWFPRVNFSGPVRKERAWFSDAISAQHDFSLVRELPSGADTSQTWSADNLLRSQYNLTSSQTLQTSFLVNALTTTREGLNAFAPASTTTDVHDHRYFVSGKDQVSMQREFLELGGAFDSVHSERLPQGAQTFVITPQGPEGNYFESKSQSSHRWQGYANLTLFGRHWHGQHDLQLGFNANQTHLQQATGRHAVEVRDTNSVLVRKIGFSGDANFSGSMTQGGGYIQDEWQIREGVILQPGLRIDRNSFIGKVRYQPRVIVNWIPVRNSTKFSAGWGYYFQPVYLSTALQPMDQQRLDMLSGTILRTEFLEPQDLTQPYFAMTSVEWQQRWTGRTSSTIHVEDRRLHDGLAYENVSTDPARQDWQLHNNRRDRYRSVEISLRHSLRDNSEVMVAYTRSQARSNELFDPSVGDLVLAQQSGGLMPWDSPNRIVSRGALPTKLWALLFSYFAEYHTGFPFSAVTSRYELVEPPNTFRYPSYFSLNIGAEKRFSFWKKQWAVRLSAINATGHHNFNAVLNDVDAPDFPVFGGGQSRAFTARLRLVGRK